MTLFRIMLLVVGAAVVLLTVVVLRVETARLHFERGRLESDCAELVRLRDARQLELDRLRNPSTIRAQMQRAFGEQRAVIE